MATDVTQFMQELDGGVFEAKLSAILSDVAAATVDNHAKGKVVVELSFSPVAGGGARVNCAHKLTYVQATRNGEIKETTKTPKQKEQFNRMRATLKKIAKGYQTPDQIRRGAEKQYGLDADEAVGYAYENIQADAASAVKGVRAA